MSQQSRSRAFTPRGEKTGPNGPGCPRSQRLVHASAQPPGKVLQARRQPPWGRQAQPRAPNPAGSNPGSGSLNQSVWNYLLRTWELICPGHPWEHPRRLREGDCWLLPPWLLPGKVLYFPRLHRTLLSAVGMPTHELVNKANKIFRFTQWNFVFQQM